MSSPLDGLDLHPVRIPMRYRFRGVGHREAVLIKGPGGWGEFSPFTEYPPAEQARWLAAALELAHDPPASPGRAGIPVNVTVPAVEPDLAAGLVAESGATTAKVKIGEPGDSIADEEGRLAAVREVLGDQGRIRVDVNASWDVETAVLRLARLTLFGLEYVEQPVATLAEMKELKRRIDIPIAADEVVRRGTYPLAVIEEDAADILVLKVQPMGGVGRVLDLAATSPIPVVISSALETSVGMYGGLLAASLLPELPYACGLGTVSLLEGDPTLHPLIPKDGLLEVRRPEPDPGLLERWHPGSPRAGEMLVGLEAAAEALT